MAAAAVESDIWNFEFDPVELKKKYLFERDRRIRHENTSQYVTIGEDKGAKYAHWLTDPWTKPIEREAQDIKTTVLILGGGFSGCMLGGRLKEQGVTDFTIIDRAGDFGGTWYWNRYPGAACDSESYCYLPMLEETGYIPTQRYVGAPEIRAHVQRMARHYGLYDKTLFQTSVKDLRWDDTKLKWTTSTDRGDTIEAQFLVTAGGPINHPKLPDLPGIETFKGHEFHTSRWDYDYTGGDSSGDFAMTKLADKRVAIIGTGATAVQAIPYLAEHCGSLHVFQRTPSAIDVRDNTPTDPEWVKTLKPGWQAKRDHNFLVGGSGGDPEELLDDGFTKALTALLQLVKRNQKTGEGSEYTMRELLQLADFKHMERIRKRCDEVVKDKKTAEVLKPYYNLLCKRPVFSDTYLQAFNNPNVTLVDCADTKGITGITEKGILVGDKEYEFDCIIWGTGYDVFGPGIESHNDFQVYGRNGISKNEKWNRDLSTLFGVAMSEFPSYFNFGIAQAGVSLNFPSVYAMQARFASSCIVQALVMGAKVIEVTKEAEEAWTKECVETNRDDPIFRTECTPGYYNAENNEAQIAKLAKIARYGPGPVPYKEKLEAFVAKGDLAAFKITK